jgi:hypothetical protein
MAKTAPGLKGWVPKQKFILPVISWIFRFFFNFSFSHGFVQYHLQYDYLAMNVKGLSF